MKLATQVQTIGKLISDTYRFFPQLATKLLPILVYMILSILILGIPLILLGIYLVNQSMALGVIYFVLVYIGLILLFSFWGTALMTKAQGLMEESTERLNNVWANAKKKFFPLTIMGLVIGILYAVVAAILGGLVYLVSVWLGTWATAIVAIPVLIFFIYFYIRIITFCGPAFILENNGIFAAISQGIALTKHHIWQIIGTIIVASIPGWVCMLLQNVLQYAAPDSVSVAILGMILQFVGMWIHTVLVITAILVLYNNAKLALKP